MIKALCFYLASFILLYLISYNLHVLCISDTINSLRFSLPAVYLFNSIFSFLLCVLFFFASKNEKYNDQLGFLYLVSFALKLIVFSIVFWKSILSIDSISKFESVSLLVSIGVFLIVEVIFISRILSKIDRDSINIKK